VAPVTHQTAAGWAAAQVEAVLDDPTERMALLSRTYDRLCAPAPRFRPAALAFMRWQAARGVLRRPEGDGPGSPWWRAVNERLLLDGCEAAARASGFGGEPSSPAVELWLTFIRSPSARTWYRAHNATIVSAYLEHRALAEGESRPERFFLNVALLRVLYVHALAARPRLALGRLATLGPVLGGPRLRLVGAYLSLGRVLPDRYPLEDELETYLVDESSLGRLIDYGVIAPRARRCTNGRQRSSGGRSSANSPAAEARSTRGRTTMPATGGCRGSRSRSGRCGALRPRADDSHTRTPRAEARGACRASGDVSLC
jgi:hypothetical protein